ncbi:unnamed protein product [Penicillium roqueforti FM164]|uniref:Genomic scaffold, ProqFM164S01 n=1 Tax=Penicillium roqueforti (strain FM164) TaxID=1365484 RepID=W6PU06_PENRF|nr:unnamed protein product [Penicillium roqueforti FM164]
MFSWIPGLHLAWMILYVPYVFEQGLIVWDEHVARVTCEVDSSVWVWQEVFRGGLAERPLAGHLSRG